MYKYLLRILPSVLPVRYTGVLFMAHTVIQLLIFEEQVHCFPQWLYYFIFPPIVYKGYTSSPTFVIFWFFFFLVVVGFELRLLHLPDKGFYHLSHASSTFYCSDRVSRFYPRLVSDSDSSICKYQVAGITDVCNQGSLASDFVLLRVSRVMLVQWYLIVV
jgi:hypothetical protein